MLDKVFSKGSTRLHVVWSFLFIILVLGTLYLVPDFFSTSDDGLARLSREVHSMRQCQRRGDNLNFYLHKYQAEKLIRKYKGTKDEIRYHIFYSDYLMQVGNRHEAIKVLDSLQVPKSDTLLWLSSLAHHGQANYYPYNMRKYRGNIEKGYDNLIQCYIFSSRNNIDNYRAVSMLLLSQYLLNDSIFHIVRQFDPASLRYINEDSVADSLLAGNLAERALHILLSQKDFYLTAIAWRSLASCYFHIGDAHTSIQCLNNALANPAIDSMPDLKAGISEQMSMSYAALDNKHMSDYYRNQFLDLQDSTRQDRQLEARLVSLEEAAHRIWVLVGIAFAVFLLLCLLTCVLVKLRHRMADKIGSKDELEAMGEELSVLRLQYSDALRALVEQRARVSVIRGMLPLIERMKHAAHRQDYAYVHDVADNIERQNEMLTGWIKLSKGSINPRIEDFPISDVLTIISQSAASLASQEIRLEVQGDKGQNTKYKGQGTKVRGDKILTLFIINTLVDNARKAILKGQGTKGVIVVSTESEGDALKVTVSDNGTGMTDEQLAHLFDIKPIHDGDGGTSHGFGLQNCRGIMERYRKISSTFSVCSIGATSEKGRGTSIFFTLPRVVRTLVMLMAVLLGSTVQTSKAGETDRLADSLYRCNVEGRYEEASQYADSCSMLTRNSIEVEEGMESTYMSIYNETAVTALALHQWNRYKYYNHLYAQLYKASTQDKMLPRYCQDMERGRLAANVAMLVVLLLIASLLPLFWFIYLRPLLRQRRSGERERERLRDETARLQREYSALHVQNNIVSNQLSTIKHETMYYPSRIRQMLSASPSSLGTLKDVVDYYSSLSTALSRQVLGGEKSQGGLFPAVRLPLPSVLGGNVTGGEDISVIANAELFRYLLLLLKRHNGGEAPLCKVTKGGAPSSGEARKYVALSFEMPSSAITSETLATLFTPSTPHTDYLVMRQIVRETADSTNAYGSGISALITPDGVPCITVTIPRFLPNSEA